MASGPTGMKSSSATWHRRQRINRNHVKLLDGNTRWPGYTTEVKERRLGDTVVHIGKAEGNMLGRKVSELHDNVLEWLHNKWREKLNPIVPRNRTTD